MRKISSQSFPLVWTQSGSLVASASATSGSAYSFGYSRVVGMVISSTKSITDGLQIKQSCDFGENWDYITKFSLSACSGSAFSIEIVGNKIEIDFYTDNTISDEFRTLWQLRPI